MNNLKERFDTISKGCGNKMPNFGEGSHTCGTKCVNPSNGILLCPTCQARLDERIRAEQDFLKMIDERIEYIKNTYDERDYNAVTLGFSILQLEELKSTIQKETKE
jgi:hypothetical protein